MFKIRKRSLPAPPPPKLTGILRNSDSPKKTRKSVGFIDTVGKPLVEYRDLPPTERDGESSNHQGNRYGRQLCSWRADNRCKWNVVVVKTARPLRSGKSETGMIEEMRLEENNISRAPLFGSFDVIEPPHLQLEAYMRAQTPVKIIPSYDVFSSPPRNESPVATVAPITSIAPVAPIAPQHTYEQVFEEPPKTNVMDLMAQLKQRGLISSDESSSPLPPVGLVIPSMQPNVQIADDSWKRRAFKPTKLCTYFTRKADGCNKGDLCRFIHDNQMRAHFMQDRPQPMRQQSYRNENWRELVVKPN